LNQNSDKLDTDSRLLLDHLAEHAPRVVCAGALARQFAAIINGDDANQLDPMLAKAEANELHALAKGIKRDIAVCAAIAEPWTTGPSKARSTV
jgi:transposase